MNQSVVLPHPAGRSEPPSYWHATAPAEMRSDDLPAVADVVVVGGGIIGVSTAYWLARAGVAVVLVERATLAAGATGRNGGLMVTGTAESYPDAVARLGHATARSVWALTVESRQLLRQVLAEEVIACDYRETGHLSLALGDEQRMYEAHVVAALHADDFAAELLDRQQVQELVATPLGPEIIGGLFTPENAQLHSARLVQGIAMAAQRHGACICVNTAVTGLKNDGDGVQVKTSAGTVRAGNAIVAVNAWTPEVVPALADIITPVRGQVLSYAPLPRVFASGMSAAITPTGEYWQQTPAGSIVLGGCRAVAPGKEVGLRECQPLAVVQEALEEIMPRLFPALTGLAVAQRWAGPMAFTPDYLPIVDRAPGVPGVWAVGGFSGHGMPFGMCLGQALTETITSGVDSPTLAHFRLDRPTLQKA